MDWDLIAKILNVAEETRHYPKLRPIHDRAVAELEKIAITPVEEKK